MIPHVTHNDEADITELEAFRKRTNGEQSEAKVTMVALLAKAVVASLKAFPVVNSSLDGDDLVLKRYYNIGFAADTPNGLVVPVIKDADKKGILRDRAADLTTLSKKARDGKLEAGEMQGATFTISSLGGIGGTSFTPIVNAPEVAILGVTRSAMKPVWNGSEFVPRLMVPLSLSYDHRVIDGALAARFVAHLVEPAVRSAKGAALMEVKVPDIGDFDAVPVIEVLVAVGDEVARRGSAGRARVRQGDDGSARRRRRARSTDITVAVGDKVAEGSVSSRSRAAGRRQRRQAGRPTRRPRKRRSRRRRRRRPPTCRTPTSRSQVAVLGGGPGGYTAAFRAADLGLDRRPDRPRRAARRRLPERRLHPVQGPAARRQGDDRGRRARRGRHRLRGAEDRRRQAARVQGRRRRAAHRRPRVARQAAQGPGRARHGRVHRRRTRSQVGDTERRLRALHHRRGLRGRDAPVPARGRPRSSTPPARSRSTTSRSGCWSSAAASSAWRWRRSTTRSARRSPSSSCSTS